jgi:hypothetical protein
MSSESLTARQADLDDPALRKADALAVLERLVSGKPLDPAVGERIRARAERVTKAIQHAHGLVDDDTFQALLDA